MNFSSSFIRGTVVGTTLSIAFLAAVPTFAAIGNQEARGPRCNPEHREAMQEALENRDYTAWSTLMEESGRKKRILEVVTADNFDTFVDMHEAMKSGDRERAQELREELGLKGHKHRMGGRRGGHGRGFGRGFAQDLTEEQREEVRTQMQSCRDTHQGDREAMKECRRNVISQYINQ